ncbi:MAG: HAD hydrolase-like protein [Oligoflexia bacterium]|nr:HAD hydrolase-like protein [Oligoflexia bacterium]
MNNGFKNILFDMDGTIMDSQKGLVKSIGHALNAGRRKFRKDVKPRKCIGMPLQECFKMLFETEDKETIDKAMENFTRYYVKKGIKNVVPYPGIEKVLHKLYEKDKNLFLVTSLPGNAATALLKMFKMEYLFINRYTSPSTGDQP